MKYEIEIKSLLGSKENANALKSKMMKRDSKMYLVSQNKQLTYYFINGNFDFLKKNIKEYLVSQEAKDNLKLVLEKGKHPSIRAKKLNEDVSFVIKASIDDSTSSNSVSRMEFEEKLPLTLDELDKILLQSGFEYQAKWSREREEFIFKNINVCIDKNAGYGYVAEFEKIVDKINNTEEAKKEIESIMHEMQVKELPQDRLERMFSFYNKNWIDYYGTDKTFVIK